MNTLSCYSSFAPLCEAVVEDVETNPATKEITVATKLLKLATGKSAS